MLLMGFTVSAQYYMIPYQCSPGTNPGGLMTETEQPANAGWTNIATSSATPVWSTTVTIPFTFLFNGAAVTQYKASTSGVVTFTTGASAVPSSTNATIPDASIPDKSVMVWGLSGFNANDVIRQKTFGTTPNRQHWIFYASYSAPGSAATNDWTYWGIVLEETTNKIYIVDMRTYNTPGSYTIGVQINSTTAVSVAGAPNTLSVVTNGGSLDTPADNVYYEFSTGTAPAYDVKSYSQTIAPYVQMSQAPFSIGGSSRNMGSNTITSMTVNYRINGGTPVSSNLTGLNIATGGCYSFTHPTNWTPSGPGTYVIKAWMSNINGSNNDQVNANDTATKTVYVAASLAVRTSLFEEPTSSTCGPCATYAPAFNALLNSNGVNTATGKVNAIKYQMNYPGAGNDPAYTTECGYRHTTYYGVPGIPWCALDGNQYQGHIANVNQTIINNAQARPGLFDMSTITANYIGTTVNVAGTFTSLVPYTSGLALHVVVVENHINSSDGGHGVQSNGETDWYQVMRKMLPGQTGTTLGALTVGQVVPVSQSYNFSGSPVIFTSLSASSVVAFIQDNSTKEILQSVWKPITLTGVTDASSPLNLFKIYPNPASDNATIMFELKQAENVKVNVTNMLGETVFTADNGNMTAGKHSMNLDASKYAAGMYFVSFTVGSKQITEKLSIEK